MPTRLAALPGDYGRLGAIARHKVNLERIRAHWPHRLRVAGPLLANTVRSYA